MPLAYGGGIAELAHCEQLNRIGVEKFVLGHRALDSGFVSAVSRDLGAQAVVGCVDVAGQGDAAVCVTRSGRQATALTPFVWIPMLLCEKVLLRAETLVEVQDGPRMVDRVWEGRIVLLPGQEATVLVGHLNGAGYVGANFQELVYLINVDKVDKQLSIAALAGRALELHPVHRAPGAADKRAALAQYDASTGRFTLPARTAVVFVVPQQQALKAKRGG